VEAVADSLKKKRERRWEVVSRVTRRRRKDE